MSKLSSKLQKLHFHLIIEIDFLLLWNRSISIIISFVICMCSSSVWNRWIVVIQTSLIHFGALDQYPPALLLYELQPSILFLYDMALRWCVTQSDHSTNFPREEALDPRFSIERAAKVGRKKGFNKTVRMHKLILALAGYTCWKAHFDWRWLEGTFRLTLF